MLPISTKELVRFTPDALKEREEAPVFLLKVPTVRENMTFTRVLLEEGLIYPSDAEYIEAMRGAITGCVADDEQAALLEIVDEFEAAVETPARAGEDEPDEAEIERRADLSARINEITATLRPHWQPLARIIANRVHFAQMAPYLRAQMFLMKIDGKPPLKRNFGRLSDDFMNAIEERYGPGTVAAIGNRIVELMQPTESEKKASPLPPPSPPDPETSTEGPLLQTGRRGKSSANGTSAIHA